MTPLLLLLSNQESSFTHNPSLASHKFQSSSATAQQVSGRGRTRKVGDAKSVEDIILESIHDDLVTDYHQQQAKLDSTKDDSKLLKKRYADVGVLANAKKTKCTTGVIDCVNGFVKGSRNSITCADACSGSCCVGWEACDEFTGSICKDQSCSGERACTSGSIKSVINSCQGYHACYQAASPCPYPYLSFATCSTYNNVSGRIQPVVNSCNGDRACAFAGSVNGRIGFITDSCNGFAACATAGWRGGSVQSIQNSCNDRMACVDIGGRGGNVGSVQNSCGGVSACLLAARKGSIGSIQDSCFGYSACLFTGGQPRGVAIVRGVGNIKGSCIGEYSCSDAGISGGYVGSIRDSCIGTGACFGAGESYGSVLSIDESCDGIVSCSGLGAAGGGGTGSLFQSCNGASACSSAGAADGFTHYRDYGFTVLDAVGRGPIDSDLIGCCNGPELCKSAKEATLPSDCI
jgi:hypothetical protein